MAERSEDADDATDVTGPGVLAMGTRLAGRYELLEVLGRAEPVVVYRGRQWLGTAAREVIVRTSTDLGADARDADALMMRQDLPARIVDSVTDPALGLGYAVFVLPPERPIPLDWLLQARLAPG